MSKQLILAKKIYTLDKQDEFFTAMIVEDGIISQITHKEQIDSLPGSYEKIHDFSDYVIIPGFNDSHIHVLSYGKYLEHINFIGASKEAFLDKIRSKVSTSKAGEWILGRGWDHEDFPESHYPTSKELDSISKDHPMLFQRICGHICVVNSKALELANITSSTPNPSGGIIDRDPLTGVPTGILREEAIGLVLDRIPDSQDEDKLRWLRNALTYLSSVGITSVQTNDGFVYDLYENLRKSNELSVRIYLTPMISDLEKLKQLHLKTSLGDDFLRWGRIKIFSDGSLGAETAALLDNYENSNQNGLLIYSDVKLSDLIQKAHSNGWQLETHAIGDRAAQSVIKAYEKTGAYENRAVLTHCQILQDNLIEQMKNLNIIANIQPVFINTDLHWAEKKIGKKRMRFSYAWKTLTEKGICCAGGSDSPIEKPDPLFGIHAAVNRQDNEGFPNNGWYIEQSLSVWEAVRLFTVNSAFAEFQEHQKGKLLSGYLADFTVLDKDIFSIAPTGIRTIEVVSTFMNGKETYKQN